MVDNYDSFTYNLVQILAMAGAEVEVRRNDASSAAEMLELGARGLVLSPGPGRPEAAGVCLDLFAARPKLPILGVCLGHQALGQAFGAEVRLAERLMHGKSSWVEHRGQGLFAGLPEKFEAARYHSLDVDETTLPPELEPCAWSEDGALMAMHHRELPYWGVQFHPESVLTEAGSLLVDNFLDLCGETAAEHHRDAGASGGEIPAAAMRPSPVEKSS